MDQAQQSRMPCAGWALVLISLVGRAQTLKLHIQRQAESDLEVTGLVAGLPVGGTGYVTRAELLRLPQVTVQVHGDENFLESETLRGLRVTGVPLEALTRALGALPASDLVDAWCSDDYRAHYPSSYLTAHHPILGLTIDGRTPSAWAAQTHAHDPSPYFITHARFVPGAKVLAHSEQPQVPGGVIRLHFSTAAATYGPIAPRGRAATQPQVQEGFAIAKQNCLRCHFRADVGGTKSGRSWSTLGTWAREQPIYFQNYIHRPQSLEPHAHMPAHPTYDQATLAALTAYFQTF